MKEQEIINRVEYICRVKDSGDEYTRTEVEAIDGLLELYKNILKERQADKEKIEELEKDYAEMLIKLNAQNLNNSIEQRKESNEQLEALNEGWKIELEKKDNRIKELESDKKIKDKMIELMAKMINTHDIDEDVCGQFGKNKDCSDYTNENLCVDCIKQYFENLAKESGEIDDK